METNFVFEDISDKLLFEDPAEDVIEEPVQAEVEDEEDEKTEDKAENEESEESDGISEDLKAEYLAVYDSIMFEDKYEKTVKLGKNYYATFVTRPAEADVTISRRIDSMKFQTVAAYQTMSAIMTMSYSVAELNGIDLRDMDAGKRYTFLKNKPSQLIELLSRHMVDFDILLRNALAYGEENF